MPFWRRKSMIATVNAYVAALNARDIEAVCGLLSADAKLIDTSGDEVSGKPQCRDVLERLFAATSRYELVIETTSTAGDLVLMRGYATSDLPHFNAVMQFRALVVDGLIHEWQSFSERPMRNIQKLMETGAEQRPAA